MAAGPRALADFAGRWHIRRRVDDYHLGRLARLEGEARFTPAPQGLIYHETGSLRIEGVAAPVPAERRYLWTMKAGRIAVLFEDGRPFHDFALAGPASSALHLCGEDEYRVLYAFGHWPEWRASWRVRGPRKDYRMETRYRREAFSASPD